MKLFIAIPAYRGIQCPQFVDALEATVNHLTQNGIDYQVSILTGCCYIQVARNKLVYEFLQSDCDKLLFLDDDIAWDAKDVVRLLHSKYPITCGVYPLKSENEDYPIVLNCNDDGIPLANSDGWLSSPRVPTGFLCISREVFDTIRNVHPHLAYIDNTRGEDDYYDMFDYFPQGVKDGRWLGEDYAFCELWNATGGVIAVIPDMTLAHYSDSKTYVGNLKQWILKQPGGINHGKE